MSQIYDNWERLVKAILLREEFRRLSREDSISSSSSSQVDWSFRESNILNSPNPNLVISFSYKQIAQATNTFNDENLIKRGHSGDLFTGFFPELSTTLVVKRISFQLFLTKEANFSQELKFFSRITNYHSRFVPLVGHCLETENEKFLVYGYLEKRDLANSLFRKTDSGIDSSLDWITRMKIARGVAQGLRYLHHECNPPLAHGDVQASSVLLDNNFEARLGSLNKVTAQVTDSSNHQAEADKVTFPSHRRFTFQPHATNVFYALSLLRNQTSKH